jgi:hypothetical protein
VIFSEEKVTKNRLLIRVAIFFFVHHTKTVKNIAKYHKIFQMSILNIPNVHKIYQHLLLKDPQKLTIIGIFWVENIQSGSGNPAPGEIYRKCIAQKYLAYFLVP